MSEHKSADGQFGSGSEGDAQDAKPTRASRRLLAEDKKARLQIVCSRDQHEIVAAAASATGTNVNHWALAHILSAARAQVTDPAAPVIIPPKIARLLRAAAAQQGIRPEILIQQLLIASGNAEL